MLRQRTLGLRAAPTKSEQMFQILSDGDWHSTSELSRRVSHAFAGSIFKLRRLGYTIEKRHHPTREYHYQYRLTEEP